MDYLVIGAGPAGLQLGWFLAQAGRRLPDRRGWGHPRHLLPHVPAAPALISINKPHTGWDDPELNLRMDWNSLLTDDPELRFTRYSDRYFPDADDYVRYLADFAATFRLNVAYDTRVTRVDRDARRRVRRHRPARRHPTERDGSSSQRGSAAPFVPPIPGIETTEPYGHVSVDPEDFVDQRVLIIGKGNSAFETADNLIEPAAAIHVAGPALDQLRLADPLRRPPARGQQQLPGHLPAQVAERGARRHDPADRARRAAGSWSPHLRAGTRRSSSPTTG